MKQRILDKLAKEFGNKDWKDLQDCDNRLSPLGETYVTSAVDLSLKEVEKGINARISYHKSELHGIIHSDLSERTVSDLKAMIWELEELKERLSFIKTTAKGEK